MGDPEEAEQEAAVDVEAAQDAEVVEADTEDEAATGNDLEKERRPSKWKENTRCIPWATVATLLTLLLIVVALYLAISRLVESTASRPF